MNWQDWILLPQTSVSSIDRICQECRKESVRFWLKPADQTYSRDCTKVGAKKHKDNNFMTIWLLCSVSCFVFYVCVCWTENWFKKCSIFSFIMPVEQTFIHNMRIKTWNEWDLGLNRERNSKYISDSLQIFLNFKRRRSVSKWIVNKRVFIKFFKRVVFIEGSFLFFFDLLL